MNKYVNKIYLFIIYCQIFIGTIPSQISRITSLSTLQLTGNLFYGIIIIFNYIISRVNFILIILYTILILEIGTIPSSISLCSTLSYMDIRSNSFTGILLILIYLCNVILL